MHQGSHPTIAYGAEAKWLEFCIVKDMAKHYTYTILEDSEDWVVNDVIDKFKKLNKKHRMCDIDGGKYLRYGDTYFDLTDKDLPEEFWKAVHFVDNCADKGISEAYVDVETEVFDFLGVGANAPVGIGLKKEPKRNVPAPNTPNIPGPSKQKDFLEPIQPNTAPPALTAAGLENRSQDMLLSQLKLLRTDMWRMRHDFKSQRSRRLSN